MERIDYYLANEGNYHLAKLVLGNEGNQLPSECGTVTITGANV